MSRRLVQREVRDGRDLSVIRSLGPDGGVAVTEIRHCFIDLDGVIVDFASAACRAVGQPHHADTTFKEWPTGQWSMAEVFGMTETDFWNEIDRHGEDWWASLEAYSWAAELVSEIPVPFTIATSPSRNPASSSGKVRWMRSYFGKRFNNFLIGSQKYLLAKPDTLLIDDNDRKVSDFREAGGHAILFPQPWNANHGITADRIGYVREMLNEVDAELGVA